MPMKCALFDTQRRQAGEDVAGLDADIVVAVGVVGGLPASAIVEGDHFARRFGAARKMKRQFMKIAAIAGQAGQADDRPVPEFASP